MQLLVLVISLIVRFMCVYLALEVLLATIESTQSLDSGDIALALASRTFNTFYSNISFDENHQIDMNVLVYQVSASSSYRPFVHLLVCSICLCLLASIVL